MKAYKFLGPGAIGPFSRFAWPAPGADGPGRWVDAAGGVALCRTAVHGCRVEHLPWWIHQELWEAEFAEPTEVRGHKLLGPRARLVRRIERWDDEAARAFSRACARRVAERAADALEAADGVEAGAAIRGAIDLDVLRAVVGRLRVPEAARVAVQMADDAAARAQLGHASTSAYIGAHAARHAAGADAMGAERRWQAGWFAANLGLVEA